MDERSRDKYVKTLWGWLLGEDKELMQTAAHILARGFITDKMQLETPQPLLISGFEEGMKRMNGRT